MKDLAEMLKAESRKQKAEMARLQRSVFPISAFYFQLFPLPPKSPFRSQVSAFPPPHRSMTLPQASREHSIGIQKTSL
jgi:hypothetical protein